MKKRRYRMKQRAADTDRTRQRIVEAAMQLHAELGPRNTTISAVAERAGVQRLTVYRHFPSETELFRACSSGWLALNPPPDPGDWEAIGEPAARARAALRALYAYYRATAPMWRRVLRDRDEVAALEAPLAEFDAYLDSIRDGLVAAWRPKGRKPALLTAAAGHAVEFPSWASLDARGLDDAQAASLMLSLIEAAAR